MVSYFMPCHRVTFPCTHLWGYLHNHWNKQPIFTKHVTNVMPLDWYVIKQRCSLEQMEWDRNVRGVYQNIHSAIRLERPRKTTENLGRDRR